MSSEAPAHVDRSLLARAMTALTGLVLAYPWATIAVGIGLALVALVLTFTRLGYRTSRLDLLNPESDYNRLWIDYINEFGDEDDAVVVVEGANREQVVPVLQEISGLLAREDQLFHAVLHGVDLNKIRGKGLHYLSQEELLAIEGFLDELGPVISGNWARLNLGNMTGGICTRLEADPQGPSGAMAEDEVDRLSESFLAVLSQRKRYQSPWPEMPQSFATLSELSSEYLLTKEGRLGFVLLRLARDKSDNFARDSEATDALRHLIAQTAARHPEVKIGLTGLPIMENDEMRSSSTSMLWASVLSFGGVALLFIAGFGGIRHAFLANIVLLLGMAWAFGYVTLSVGHLNILSVSFTVTLIGIGIDYGVYYVSRYLQLRGERVDCHTALMRTTNGVGPAILTGALTTAIAFFAAGCTDFIGIAELGIIAGGGVLLCAAAELIVLPASIYLLDKSSYGQRFPTPLPVHNWIAPLLKKPRMLLCSTLGFTTLAAMGLGQLWYDHNLLNLQPEGLESVELERKLLTETNQSVWYALSISDNREELLTRKAQLLALPSVERTEEIVSLLPVDHALKQPIIQRLQQRLAELPERPPLIPVDRPEQLGQVLAHTQELLASNPRCARSARRLEQVRDYLRRLPLSDCYATLSHFQQQMAGDLLSRLHALRGMANPEPPQLADLPESLVHRFVGHNGRYLLKIYGRGNIWDMEALATFVKDVRSVDPRATGNPLQAYEASIEMKHSYEEAALYALAIIMAVLLFDFKSLRYALLASLPLGMGMLQTFGLLGILGIPLNPANMIALPLILGIGVDYGVHIVHDYLEQKGRYSMSPSAAVAVLVDSLTTIVGFGSLMIASHQGLQSLGRVLTLGVTCCLFTSMIMLPALLTWMSWNRGAAPEEPAEEPPAAPGRQRTVATRRDPPHYPGGGPHRLTDTARVEHRHGREEAKE